MGYDVFTKNDIILDASSPVDLGKLMMSPLEVGIAEVEVVAEKRQLVYKLDKKVVEASSNMMGGYIREYAFHTGRRGRRCYFSWKQRLFGLHRW